MKNLLQLTLLVTIWHDTVEAYSLVCFSIPPSICHHGDELAQTQFELPTELCYCSRTSQGYSLDSVNNVIN